MTQHIVIVDEAETNLEIIAAMVADIPSAFVHPFTDSSEALAWANDHQVDAFIIDYTMPDPDGLAMIVRLRAEPRFRLVPIVVVTAAHEFDVRLAALAAGANDFLERPIERSEVLSRVQTLLALQAAHSLLAERVGHLEARARMQAERLATLWRVANESYDQEHEDMLQAVLSEGAAMIRRGQPFFGSLGRIEGDEYVLVAAARSVEITRTIADLNPIGTRVPLADMAHARVVMTGETHSWDDLATDVSVVRLPRIVAMRERALIATPFFVGRTQYVLSFGSTRQVEKGFDDDDRTYVQLLADFFASRLREAAQSDQLQYHMTHDILTGLRNRTQFRLDARTNVALTRTGALIVISLDGFRGINEEYGHIIGDALLVEVGAALAQAVTERDVVARLAGDTFGLFLSGIANEQQLRARLEALSQVFTRPFSTGDRNGKEFVPVGATIGAALANRTETIDQLLAHADTAAFAAKERGPGHVEIYRSGLQSESASRARRLSEISQGLENDEFELFFQPHLEVETSTIVGAEALLRWRHPSEGLLLPDAFLPFAERYGLIRTITRWVTESALRAAEQLRGLDPAFRVYFNLSAIDFSDEAIVSDLRLAAAGGLHLENIGVELTETAAMHDFGSAARTVRQLQDLGVSVAIDDFGTGFSSLSMLKRLPFDIIKIDRSFISEVTLGESDAAIAASIIAIGEQLGSQTLAEGVETPEQLAWLKRRGCRYAQGYAIAHPMPLGAFESWLVARMPPSHVV